MAKTARALWAQGKYVAASHVWQRAMRALINEMEGYFIMELLCDSRHGVYIPQIIARRLFDAGWSGITLDDVIQLEIDPYEGEWYWETWEGVLNNARFKDETGTVWYLHHDGDLFVVTALDLDDLGDNY